MSFQTSCMVLVKDEKQQIKLEKWVKSIGWRIIGGRQNWSNYFLADKDHTCFWLNLDENDLGLFDQDFHDCGENIEMFKALAAMHSDNDRDQWFIAHAVIRFNQLKDTVQTETGAHLIMAGDWFKVLIPKASDIQAKWMSALRPKQLCHKATKDEIIEHFTKEQ